MRPGVGVAVAVLFVAGVARADQTAPFDALGSHHVMVPAADERDEKKEHRGLEPGWFTTLGSKDRLWELRSDTAFGTARAFTERVELAHFFSLSHFLEETNDRIIGEQFGIVTRASFGIADDTLTGIYNPLGPLPAIGVRFRTVSDAEWIELGIRALVPYPGPSNALPGMQALAFKAATSSGIADDAAWLPLESWGSQLYLATQARTSACRALGAWTALGAAGGGAISLGSVNVTTWLGPQPTFIGNAFMEVFVDLQRWATTTLNLQVGVHGEVSLSAIWPGRNSMPVLVNGFLGWSPHSSFALRLFYGIGESVLAGNTFQQYGVRAQLYFK